MHINVEFKARCEQPKRIKEILEEKGAEYKGQDHQIDVYFDVPRGRLKLRKGNIENSLIGYEREDVAGAKQSNVHLFNPHPGQVAELEEVLRASLGVRVIVDKRREIYFIGNVKFHVDEVKGLGSFIEVEAIDSKGDIGREKLQERCDHYRRLFGVQDEDMIAQSYSDLVLASQLTSS